MDISVPPTTPAPEYTLCAANSGALAVGVKVGEHSLVRIRSALPRRCRRSDRRSPSRAGRLAQRRRISGRDRSSDQTNVSRS